MFKQKNKNTSSPRRAAPRSDVSFRRNNIVISRSQREVSAHKQSVSQRQADFKHAQKARIWKRRAVIAGVVVIVAMLGNRLQISNVMITHGQAVRASESDEERYSAHVYKYVASHVPLRQFWLLDEASVRSNLQTAYPEIKTIIFSSREPFSTSLQIELEYRKPAFVLKSLGQTYYVDKQGVLFSRNVYTTVDEAKLPQIEDLAGTAPRAGSTVLTDVVVKDIAKLYARIPEYYAGAKVGKIVLPKATREIQLQVTGVAYLLKFSTDYSIDEQMGELVQVLDYLHKNSITPTSYIDLRVAHKAFYK